MGLDFDTDSDFSYVNVVCRSALGQRILFRCTAIAPGPFPSTALLSPPFLLSGVVPGARATTRSDD
jgi:hypothetical protein